MNYEQCSVLVVGGSDAGKTNYILRLWLSIFNNTGLLQADGLPDEFEYLRSGSEDLLKGNFAPKTAHDVYNRIVIPFKHGGTTMSVHGKLVVPDRWGEKWVEIYRKREWSKDWEDLISEACGCLLFIRADSDSIVPLLDWITCEKLYGALATSELRDDSEIPSEVIMIDWLQFLKTAFSNIVGRSFRPRVGIVVAAWDLVPQEQQELGPHRYLENNFPMLTQFMNANPEEYEFAVFGVTITGGNLNQGEFKKEYLRKGPLSAGYVLHTLEGSLSKTGDLTLPAAWAIGLTPKI